MRIKICGMRDPENIRAVEEKVKPDMMGFIFWKGSKRCVTEVPAYLPQCTRVGVFVNPTEEEVLQKVKDFGLNALQMHGEESPDFCRRIKEVTGLPIIKAISVASEEVFNDAVCPKLPDLENEIADQVRDEGIGGWNGGSSKREQVRGIVSMFYDIASAFLFDTKCKCVGGSGEQFNWDILQHYKGDTPFLLAGGIGPGDEEKVRRWRHPRWIGIDLNSRFETAPALKDVEALAKFKRLAVSG